MKLSAPLRVCWDWNWPPVLGAGDDPGSRGDGRGATAAALARARVLMLEIGYPAERDILDGSLASALRTVGASSTIVVSGPDFRELEGQARTALASCGEVWVDATADLQENGGDDVSSPEHPAGIRIYLTKHNIEKSADFLAGAVEAGAGAISLPILPLFGSFLKSPEKYLPSWRDLMTFADRLDPLLRRRCDVKLHVHYQALWLIFRERGIGAMGDEAPGHSGCQAASALGYIDPAGVLYPCAALPIPLAAAGGDLGEAWKSPEAERIRAAVANLPSACETCPDLHTCRGGCRGWAHYLSGEWRTPGPDCGRDGKQGRRP